MKSNSESLVQISSLGKGQISGQKAVRVRQGVATLTELVFEGEPGKEIDYQIDSSAIDPSKIKILLNSEVNDQISVEFRDCKAGEEKVDNTCLDCGATRFTLLPNSPLCKPCMAHAVCAGLNQVEVEKGFWRDSQTQEEVIPCNFEEACLGGFEPSLPSPVKCQKGYQGVLCQDCVKLKVNGRRRYMRTEDSKCQECPNPFLNTF